MPFPSASQLRKAADLTEKIEAAQAELSALLGGQAKMPAKRGRPAKAAKRAMSEEGRKKIAAAQKKRWATAKKAAKAEAAAE